MSVTPKRLGQVALGITPTLVAVVPASTTATIRSITIANTAVSSRRATVWAVPFGGSIADGTLLIPGVVIPANGVLQDDAVHVLEQGGEIVGQGDLAGLTATVDGAWITP